MIGVSEEQLRQCTMNAARAAFCSEEIREKLIRQIIQKNA
jgi:adenosine deaminase